MDRNKESKDTDNVLEKEEEDHQKEKGKVPSWVVCVE